MANNSLISAIAAGVRPGFIKAQLQNWLGVPIRLTDGSFWRDFGMGSSWGGKSVTVDQALQLATVWACVRLISETMATLPLGFYKRNADGSRTMATNHTLYEILHNQPNADMTAVIFWEVVVGSMLLWGNAYVEIVRQSSVQALLFLHPARVSQRVLKDGRIEYRYRDMPNGVERVIAEENLMHIPAFSIDGRLGLSPIAYGANVMGTSMETDKASAETFRTSMRSPGILTTDVVLNLQQRETLRAHINKVSTEGGVMVVEKGTGFEKLTFNPVDAELLASRSWNVEEMCRWYRVDPSMIGHGGKDSNWGTGLEQKMIWFLTFTLRHWCVRIEQAVRKSLLTPVERQTYYAEFAIEGLLRADSAARSAFYSSVTQNGIYTRDECRQLENLPVMGGNADLLTVQSNMLPIDKLGMTLQPPAPPADAGLLAAFGGLRAELRTALDRPQPPQQPINIDARTTVNPAEVTVNMPEMKLPDTHVEVAAPVVNVSSPEITVNTPEMKASDVKVDVAAPVVTVNPLPEKIAAGTVLSETTKEVLERDSEGRILKVRETEVAS